MSGLSNVNREGYSKYDRMSTEALAELLRLDIQAPEEESLDIEAIMYITEVIANREKDSPSGSYPVPDVDAAWEEFQTKYRPCQTDGRSLYDFDDEIADKPCLPSAPPPKSKRRAGVRWLGRIAAVAAALLVALTATAYAMGYDLWAAVARWGKDTFTFISEPAPAETENTSISVPTNKIKYDSLQEALDAYGITTPLAPTWIPEGFELDEVVVVESTMSNTVSFQTLYNSSDKYLSIYINMFNEASNTDYSMWEKDDTYVNKFEENGITHYFLQNDGNPMIVWKNGPFECHVWGNLSSEDLTNITKSVYKENVK